MSARTASAASAATGPRPDDLIDLDRYPIADMDSRAARDLVARCRNQFDDAVSCHLPGFLRSDAVRLIVKELEPKVGSAHLYSTMRGAYNLEDPKSSAARPALSESDPRAMAHRRHQRWLGYDDLGPRSALSVLYHWPNLTRFVGEVLGQAEFYAVDDPLMKVLVNIFAAGDELGWHVDSHDFAVTLLLQEAEGGGKYQYVPHSGPGDVNFERVPALFQGDTQLVRTVPMTPGSMVLFRGRNTLHRVTEAAGNRLRLLGLFAYEPVPHRIFGDSFKLNVLGRATPRQI